MATSQGQGLSGPHLQILSIPSLLPLSILSLLPFLISPSLSTIPSCFLINCLSKDKHFMFHSVSLHFQAPLACGSLLFVALVSILGAKFGAFNTSYTFQLGNCAASLLTVTKDQQVFPLCPSLSLTHTHIHTTSVEGKWYDKLFFVRRNNYGRYTSS